MKIGIIGCAAYLCLLTQNAIGQNDTSKVLHENPKQISELFLEQTDTSGYTTNPSIIKKNLQLAYGSDLDTNTIKGLINTQYAGIREPYASQLLKIVADGTQEERRNDCIMLYAAKEDITAILNLPCLTPTLFSNLLTTGDYTTYNQNVDLSCYIDNLIASDTIVQNNRHGFDVAHIAYKNRTLSKDNVMIYVELLLMALHEHSYYTYLKDEGTKMSVEEKQHYVHLKKLLKKIAVIENIHLIETLKQLKALYPSESEELEQQRLASKD